MVEYELHLMLLLLLHIDDDVVAMFHSCLCTVLFFFCFWFDFLFAIFCVAFVVKPKFFTARRTASNRPSRENDVTFLVVVIICCHCFSAICICLPVDRLHTCNICLVSTIHEPQKEMMNSKKQHKKKHTQIDAACKRHNLVIEFDCVFDIHFISFEFEQKA